MNPNLQPLAIVSVHSYKGGVGKTTLAALMAAAFAERNKNVCLVDLDLLAPALTMLLKIKGYGTSPRGHETQYDIGDFLFGRYDEQRQRCVEVNAEQACHLAGFPWPGADHMKVQLVPARTDFNLALRAQSYLLAEARSRVLEARIEFMLKELQKNLQISIFVLDVPPSLFGISDAVRRIAEKWKGALVQISTPTRPDMIGTQEMLVQMLEERPAIGSNANQAVKHKRRPPNDNPQGPLMALIMNRCPWDFSSGEARAEVARVIGRAFIRNTGNRNFRTYESQAERWLENFQEVAVIQESDNLAYLLRVRLNIDERQPSLNDLLGDGVGEFAARLLEFFGSKAKP